MNYHLTIDSFIGPWAYSKQYVRNVLSGYAGKHVDVKISSLGGNLDHGLDIRQQFLDHGDVTVYLSGGVASAATVIAMGAKRVVMGKYAMFLVHKCSNFIDAWGSYNADQMQTLINELEANKKENDKIDVVLANMYASRCKKKVSEILDILKEGRWLTAQEALDLGFVDEVADFGASAERFNYSWDIAAKLNALGISTVGLPAPERNDEPAPGLDRGVSAISRNPKQSLTPPASMKKFNFSRVESLLKLDSMTPDNDGYISVTAEQFEAVNNRLEELENDVAEKTTSISAKDAKIEQLTTQVENLKGAPGDETNDIEDDAGENTGLSAHDLFNSIKSSL